MKSCNATQNESCWLLTIIDGKSSVVKYLCHYFSKFGIAVLQMCDHESPSRQPLINGYGKVVVTSRKSGQPNNKDRMRCMAGKGRVLGYIEEVTPFNATKEPPDVLVWLVGSAGKICVLGRSDE